MDREHGFTLVELVVVLVIIGALTAVAVSFHLAARERAGDATAQTAIRVAVPALESYRLDHGGYAGVTIATLRSEYSPSLRGIQILASTEWGYCVRATVEGRSWYKAGPQAEITRTACP